MAVNLKQKLIQSIGRSADPDVIKKLNDPETIIPPADYKNLIEFFEKHLIKTHPDLSENEFYKHCKQAAKAEIKSRRSR